MAAVRRFLLAAVVLMLPQLQASVHASPVTPIYPVPGGVATTRKIVALTFDDGPSIYTPRILAVLAALHVPATFFVIGRQVSGFAAVLRAAAAAGNEIGNHTFNHPDLRYLSSGAIGSEVQQTQDAVRAAAGVTPLWLRPPDGDVDAHVVQTAAALGLRTVLWNVDPRDWSLPGVDTIIARVLAQAHPGSVILMHDGGGDRSETVAALPTIIRTLQSDGYQFLTVSALFGVDTPQPCDSERALRRFSGAGIGAQPSHAIYRAWLDTYCNRIDLGPATSGEYTLAKDVVAQDFARTAHRIEWSRRSSTTHISLMWGWAARVFGALGIKPRWHTPLTRAWFDQYFRGSNYGPARTLPNREAGATVQCFTRGCAVLRQGKVTWRLPLPASHPRQAFLPAPRTAQRRVPAPLVSADRSLKGRTSARCRRESRIDCSFIEYQAIAG